MRRNICFREQTWQEIPPVRVPRVRFTVRRIMAVVAVVATILAVGSGAVGLIREQDAIARHEQCRRNLPALAIALGGYQYAKGAFPPGTLHSESLPPERRISWIPLIYPWTDFFQGVLR